MNNNQIWGLGIEHEFHLFHIKNNNYKNPIVFDSQESTCFFTRKYKDCCYAKFYNYSSIQKDITKYICCEKSYGKSVSTCWPTSEFNIKSNLKSSDLKFLNKLEYYEVSGRYIDNEDKNCKFILPRIPINMIEIITYNPIHKKIEEAYNELIKYEKKYINLQYKNPYTQQKISKYGPIKQYKYGMVVNAKIPQTPTTQSKSYKYIPKRKTDYTGSYHITITLPYKKKISRSKFIAIHEEFARQIQWIEPLLVSSFFTPDLRSSGDNNKYTEGSFRVIMTGWGNFAGSDVRKIKHGISRASNIKPEWRKDLSFNKKLKLCNLPDNRKYSSDIRTISEKQIVNENNEIILKTVPMKIGEGIEIRIYDHFPTKYLYSLLQIILLVADNSLTFANKSNKGYVYNNKNWINTMHDIMIQGWNAKVSTDYIKNLEQNLDIKIKYDSLIAFDIFNNVISQLFNKNKDGLCQRLMSNRKYKKYPHLPKINRYAWEYGFYSKFQESINKFLKNKFIKHSELSKKKFKDIFYKSFNKNKWKDDIDDLLYALESKNLVTLEIVSGNIKSITIKN